MMQSNPSTKTDQHHVIGTKDRAPRTKDPRYVDLKAR